MAYPTESLRQTLQGVDLTATSIKLHCQGRIAAMAAGNTTSGEIFNDYFRLQQADGVFAAAATTAGLADYAKTEKNDAALDVVAEFTAMRAAIASSVAWIEANFPASGGYLLSQQISGGQVIDRQFTPAETSGYQSALQAVVSTIG